MRSMSPRVPTYLTIPFLLFASSLMPIGGRWNGGPLASHDSRGQAALAGHKVVKLITPDPSDPYPLNSSRLCNIHAIVQDATGRYWLNGASLFIFDESNGRWTWAEARAFTRGAVIDSSEGVFEDRYGKIWALDWLRPSYFDGNQWRHPDVPEINESYAAAFPEIARRTESLSEVVTFRTMLRTMDGNLWFIRSDEMLEHDGQSWVAAIRLPNEIENTYRNLQVHQANVRRALTLREVSDNNLLLRAGKEKAMYLDLIHRRPATLFSETYCALEDKQGHIWLGADKGILRLDPVKPEWKLYPLPKNLTQAALVYEGRDGRLWFADIYGNAAVYDKRNDSWTGYKITDQNARKSDLVRGPAYSINAIYQDRAGRLMFGAFNGLIVFSEAENRWEHFTAENSALPGTTLIGSDKRTANVTALTEDRTGRIWVASNGGIVILDQ